MEKVTKLSVIGLGLSAGLAWALAVLVAGIIAMVMQEANVEAFKDIFNLVYPGWGMSVGGTLLMVVWSFTHGFVAGFLIGIFYNFFSTKFN